MLMRVVFSLFAYISLSCAGVTPTRTPPPPSRPTSIILMIADGAGPAHFTVARMLRGPQFQTGRLPFTGLVATSPVTDSIVTDSAAAATAYATGFTTTRLGVGVDAAGNPRPTALQIARDAGKSTGLVTTTNFWDATPAAFAAHTPSRYATDDIIRQMLASGVDLIIGGGAARFGAEGRPALKDVAAATGFALALTYPELERAGREVRLLAVFRTEPHEVDFTDVRLPVLARAAIDRLSHNPNGFFLLIEHEGPDGASHANETQKFIDSMISFDEAVGVAREYVSARTDVLLVVTADHATGGLQILREAGKELELRWATKGHTGEAVPIFAAGPGAELFVGFMDGAEVGRRLQQLLRDPHAES